MNLNFNVRHLQCIIKAVVIEPGIINKPASVAVHLKWIKDIAPIMWSHINQNLV
jgi:hypothetical protein